MNKRMMICALTMFMLTTNAIADICPSVKDIQSNKLTGWKAYDSDDGKPLSAKRLHAFTKAVDQFILAEWSNRSKSGTSIHCFYRDTNGSDLDAYLTQHNLIPENNKTWYQVSGAMQCAAGNDTCKFAKIPGQTHLAKK